MKLNEIDNNVVEKLRFSFKENIEPENRGFIVDYISASINGEEVGYIKGEYIPEKLAKFFYPTVFHYMKNIGGWGGLKDVIDGKIPDYKSEEFWRSLIKYANWNWNYVNGSTPDLEARILDIKKIAREKSPQFKKFLDWNVGKPKIGYIRILNEINKRKGIATSLYVAAAKWYGKKGLALYASVLQQPAAKAVWEYMQSKGYPISSEKTLDKEHPIRIKLDYRS